MPGHTLVAQQQQRAGVYLPHQHPPTAAPLARSSPSPCLPAPPTQPHPTTPPRTAGSTVSTKHGNVNTDYILFICSGAFHSCKPSDMLAELQGRLPIRVELKGLT